MRARAAAVVVLLAVLVGATGCAARRPPVDRSTAAALEELRRAHDKLAGPYRADFSMEFSDGASLGIPRMTWSGTLTSTGEAWAASGDLKRNGEPFAHLDVVQTGDTRYLRQTGEHIGTGEKWWGIRGRDVGTYFWRAAGSVTGTADVEAAPLPDVDPRGYLALQTARTVERSDLRHGGRRYEPNQWVGDGDVWRRLERFGPLGPALTVDLDREGAPTEVTLRLTTTTAPGSSTWS
jgi:hypothetical protein